MIRLVVINGSIFMSRSFTDRVFGGVCGGLALGLPFGTWALRWLFVVLTILSAGMVALLYVVLWWLMPPETSSRPARANSTGAWVVLLIAFGLTGAVWFGVFGEMLLPGLLMIVGAVFFLRQLRG
jgi:phage shock protein PspC (stress-responsive transcriptional regulator)